MLSRFHLLEMEHLPSKSYKEIISGLYRYFYEDEVPSFKSRDNEKIFNKMVSFIENGLK